MSNTPSEKRKTPYDLDSLRAAAESQLVDHPVAELANATNYEEILHELQVHQIELEMQNEELRQAHVALEESRDRYLDLFEYAPIGYFKLTATGLIAEVNCTGASLIGVDRKKLLLQPFSRFIAPEFCDQFHVRLSRLLHDTGPQQSYDMQIKREDDSICYVHVDALRVKADDGTITLRVTLTDISENKRIEEALKESEQRFRSVAEAVPQIVWITKPDGWNIYFNQQWMDYTGLTLGESLGHGWNIPFHPDDKQAAWDAWQHAVSTNGIYSIESRLRRADGVYRWWLIRGLPLKDEKGKVINWYGTCTDISTQKEVEQDLRIAATAFEAQEGIMVTDEHHKIIRVNRAFSRLTGFSATDATGRPASLISSGQHDPTFFKSMFATICSDLFWHGEILNKRKNGEIFPCLMTVTAVIDAKGRTTNYVGSFFDITIQKQAEKILLDARKQLEQQVEITSAELTTIKNESEDVNTALRVMMKMQHTENHEAKSLLNEELKQEVLPFLRRLKSGNQDTKQIRLINTLEANLQRLISSYGGPTTITSSYRSLTPKEIQVATMVREGFSTKVIAATLSLSPETISIHRKNIRKKLGLDSKAENLRSYLITFEK
jgi:PAS domain S-box-containing protein